MLNYWTCYQPARLAISCIISNASSAALEEIEAFQESQYLQSTSKNFSEREDTSSKTANFKQCTDCIRKIGVSPFLEPHQKQGLEVDHPQKIDIQKEN